VMDVTLGRAFEGAPGRAHGGVVAALIDETMVSFSRSTASSPSQDNSISPTSHPRPLARRSARERGFATRHRKLFVEASVRANDVDVAKASALFIAVDPTKFLKHLVPES